MELKHRHIISIGLLLCGLLGFASCTNESFELPREEEEDNSIFLTFHTAVAGASTRADGDAAADEAIRQLLVVIVSEEPDTPEGMEGEAETDATTGTKWVVEHNRLVKGASIGLPLTDGYTFKVKAGCRKRIYLIANYTGLKDTDGSPLDFTNEAFIPESTTGRAEVDDYVFAVGNDVYAYAPETHGIPMTAMYEIKIPERKEIKGDEYELSEKLYIVRAATKMTFNFIHTGSVRNNITIKRIEINNIAEGKTFLMPHVNKNNSNQYWVADTDRKTSVPLPIEGESTGTDKDWIAWMIQEVDKTKDDKNIEQYQWLTDYEVPEGTQHTAFIHEWEEGFPVASVSEESTKTFYLPESRNFTEEDNNDLLLQKYELTLTTSEEFGEQNDPIIEERVYNTTLPQLASLFRNTHAKVNVTFKDYDLKVEVALVPYAEVELEPDFGLDNPWQRLIPIYDQDRTNILCYYDPESGKYYKKDGDNYIETVNPFWSIDAGTGRIIGRDENGNIIFYYDKENDIYYGPDGTTVIPNPYENNKQQ